MWIQYRRHLAPLVVAMLSLAPALAALLGAPVSATPIVVDTFSDGSTGGRLNFSEHAWNDSLGVELPRGARIMGAEMTVAGIEGISIHNVTMDLGTDPIGDDLWVVKKFSSNVYPPEVDPYNSGWPGLNTTAIPLFAKEDNSSGRIFTEKINSTPPFYRSYLMFHFHPKDISAVTYTVVWNGYGQCTANQTATNQAEMWLYDQSDSTWDRKAHYETNASGDFWLNATVRATDDFVSANGSIDVIITGPHSLALATPPVSANAYIYTDYIGLIIGFGTGIEYPTNATLHLGGAIMNLSAGPFKGQLKLDDAIGFRDALQAAVDAETVMPGTVIIPFFFRVQWLTQSAIEVGPLHVEYEMIVNAPPVWRGPTAVETEEDSTWTEVLDLGAAFSDDWNQDELRYVVVNVSDPANLSTQKRVGFSGNWTLMARPAADFFGEVTVVLNATDMFGEVATSPPIAVRVLQVPDRPFIDDPGELQASEGVRFQFAPTVRDPDLPDDALTWSDGTDLLDVDASTGAIDWTPGKDQIGTHRVPVTVTDRFGLQGVRDLTIVVANSNDPPVITSPLALEVDQDQAVVYGIVAADPDSTFGDILTFSANSEDIEVQCDAATGEVTFTPTNDDVGRLEVSLQVQDKLGLKDERVLVVTVRNVNDPPVLQDVAPQTHDQWEEVSLQLQWSDPDLSVAGAGERLTMTSDGPAWLAPDAAGWVNFTADTDKIGVWTVNYTVKDALGLADTVRVVWTIIDINDPPVVMTVVPALLQATEGQSFTYSFAVEDADGDALSWAYTSDIFITNPSSWNISFTPEQRHVGTHHVTLTFADGHGGTTSVTFDLVVANVNDAPVIKDMAPLNGTRYKEGEAVSLEATATDRDGDALTYIWKEKGRELGRGSTFTTAELRPGRHTITLAVTDGNATVERQLKVEVVAKEGEGLPILPLAIIGLVVVVVIVVAAIAMRARKRAGAFPAKVETASLAGPTGEAEQAQAKADGDEEPPKIEIEYREV